MQVLQSRFSAVNLFELDKAFLTNLHPKGYFFKTQFAWRQKATTGRKIFVMQSTGIHVDKASIAVLPQWYWSPISGNQIQYGDLMWLVHCDQLKVISDTFSNHFYLVAEFFTDLTHDVLFECHSQTLACVINFTMTIRHLNESLSFPENLGSYLKNGWTKLRTYSSVCSEIASTWANVPINQVPCTTAASWASCQPGRLWWFEEIWTNCTIIFYNSIMING